MFNIFPYWFSWDGGNQFYPKEVTQSSGTAAASLMRHGHKLNGCKPVECQKQIRKRRMRKLKNTTSGTFRRKTNFAAVSNCALKDPRLSLKAKGLYALIQSYITMPDKRLKKSDLIKKCKEGEKAFETIWKELKETGYLKIYRNPTGKDGGFIQAREAIWPYIDKVDSEAIQGFMEHMRGKSMRNVRNVGAYWQSAFIDYLRGRELTLLTAD